MNKIVDAFNRLVTVAKLSVAYNKEDAEIVADALLVLGVLKEACENDVFDISEYRNYPYDEINTHYIIESHEDPNYFEITKDIFDKCVKVIESE